MRYTTPFKVREGNIFNKSSQKIKSLKILGVLPDENSDGKIYHARSGK